MIFFLILFFLENFEMFFLSFEILISFYFENFEIVDNFEFLDSWIF